MSNEIQVNDDSFSTAMRDVEMLQKLCSSLMKFKHFEKIGEAGIFAIVQKAKSMGLNPIDALNGGIYIVQGKTELSANTMNYLIRAAGHSISKDPKSDKSICILHGKRKDNGDTWTSSFSLEDAKRAGIMKSVWLTYPEDMMFNRALTRLARQLFADVIKGCYTEGEVRNIDNSRDANIQDSDGHVVNNELIDHKPPIECITKEQANEIELLLEECEEEDRNKAMKFITETLKVTSIDKIPISHYERIKTAALAKRNAAAEKRKREVEESRISNLTVNLETGEVING